MCLTIKKIRHLNKKPKIARKPIKCYKYVVESDGGYRSPYLDTFWNTKGVMHGYVMEPDSFQEYQSPDGCIYHGIHSVKELDYLTKMNFFLTSNFPCNPLFLECVIPKGAKYWIGENNEYCSEKLMINCKNYE